MYLRFYLIFVKGMLDPNIFLKEGKYYDIVLDVSGRTVKCGSWQICEFSVLRLFICICVSLVGLLAIELVLKKY